MNEKLIKSYVEFVFEFLKDCKEGEGLFLRTIKFKAEKVFTRKQRNELYFVLDLLLRNDYLECKEGDFVYLTRKGFNYMNGDIVLCLNIALDEQLIDPQKPSTGKSKVFSKLWEIIGHYQNALYPVSGPAFYDSIKPYLSGLPVSYSKYTAKLKEDDKSTSRVEWCEDLFMRLETKDIIPFLKDLSAKINQTIDLAIKSISAAEDIWDSIPPNTESLLKNPSLPKDVQPVVECPDIPVAVPHMDIPSVVKDGKCPRVLISYAWEKADEDFMKWILDFAGILRGGGIDAQIDRYQPHGTDLVKFMLDEIRGGDRVVCVLTPTYKKKAESGKGGASFEGTIMSHNIYSKQDTTKFIPVLKKGTWETSTPDFMVGRKGFDFVSQDEAAEIEDLIKVLKGEHVVDIPPIKR